MPYRWGMGHPPENSASAPKKKVSSKYRIQSRVLILLDQPSSGRETRWKTTSCRRLQLPDEYTMKRLQIGVGKDPILIPTGNKTYEIVSKIIPRTNEGLVLLRHSYP